MYQASKCNVRFILKNIRFFELNYFLAIHDDIMDVDRVVDEDKDSDPNKVRTNVEKLIIRNGLI
jgi:hypothetical protein